MPIVPAPYSCTLELDATELRVTRDALAGYVQKELEREEKDAAWAVLAEISHKMPKKPE
jgi:hypothetical protein